MTTNINTTIYRKLTKKEAEIKIRQIIENEIIKSLTEQSHILLSFCLSVDDSDLSDSNNSNIEDSSIYKSPPKKRGR